MALHPQAKAFLAGLEASGAPPPHELSPEEARAATGVISELIGAGPEVATVENFTIPTTAGVVGARRYVPEDAAATILWIHGGGWVICDLDTHDAVCRLLAESSGCRVIAVDYRRAPEHPFPAPLEDCWDALGVVAADSGDAPLIIAGESGPDLFLTAADMEWFWNDYVPEPAARSGPRRVAVARRGPVVVTAGDRDHGRI
jgi:acetyl esterase/lipase